MLILNKDPKRDFIILNLTDTHNVWPDSQEGKNIGKFSATRFRN